MSARVATFSVTTRAHREMDRRHPVVVCVVARIPWSDSSPASNAARFIAYRERCSSRRSKACEPFTTRRQTRNILRAGPPQSWYDRLGGANMVHRTVALIAAIRIRSSSVWFDLSRRVSARRRLRLIALQVPMRDDLMFSSITGMTPVAVASPIFHYRRSAADTASAVRSYGGILSLAVWAQGFIDEIRENVSGGAGRRLYAAAGLLKVVLQQMRTASPRRRSSLICYWKRISSRLLTSGQAQTAPPFIPLIIGEGGLDWPAVAAGTTLFILPVVIFTVMLRNQLLRGITFGAVRR